jgi:hypothetical protein
VSLFGPYYPPELQRSVNHAERVAELLATPELSAGGEPWVLGRSEEIETYVAAVVADWKAASKTDREAAALIDSYLTALHQGMLAHLEIRQPRCCNTTDPEPEGIAAGEPTLQVVTEPLGYRNG